MPSTSARPAVSSSADESRPLTSSRYTSSRSWVSSAGMAPSVAFGDVAALPDGRLIVVGALLLSRRQVDLVVREFLVGDLRQDVRDRIQPRRPLVIGAEDVPG